MKPYFAKWLPVSRMDSSQNWQWNNNVKNTGWESISPSDMDAIIAHGLEPEPQFRKVKLFLCSRDIKVGDKAIVEYYYPDGPKAGTEVTISAIDNVYMHIIWDSEGYEYSNGLFKVIGEISPEATWVKEGDEFDENQVRIDCLFDDRTMLGTNDKWYTQIKGPCGHFH